MRLISVLAFVSVVLGGLSGCGSNQEEPKQKTPPPTTQQLGTGQQFGYPPPGKK